MNDVGETVDAANDYERHSRRDRFKDVVLRTKGKWKKEKEKVPQPQANFQLSDDVNDFLAAGRKPTTTTSVRQVADDIRRLTPSPRLSTADSHDSNYQQPSTHGSSVPRLDTSQSRWPNARTIIASTEPRPSPQYRHSTHLSPNHLSPDHQDRGRYERSHSYSSALAKKGSKPRGLSVTFLNAPPTIIGEGGDESQIPPSEISRAHAQRARSLSPYADRPSSQISIGSNGQSPVRRKPIPSPSPPGSLVNTEREDSMFQPRPVRRTQTGFNEHTIETPASAKTLEQQLPNSIQLGRNVQQSSIPLGNSPPQRRDYQHSEPTRQPHNVQPITTNFQASNNQQTYKPVQHHEHQQWSPVHRPDLQQSRETSTKVPPPKMQNFYAQLNGQKFDSVPESEKRLPTSQFRETSPISPLRSPLNASVNLEQNSYGLPQRVQNTPQRPPEGWI